jgi:RNA polymerase sigma factor (sigma-70 family)
MTFPQTRITLIERLATGGSDDDWRAFLDDYWGPVFHFCLRRGVANRSAAEEITSDIFIILSTQDLLRRWQANRTAKLRTLICAVARNLLAQHFRAPSTEPLGTEPITDASDEDCFYRAWAEDLLRRSLDTLAASYRRHGQGDYLRVFLGRACEGLSIREVGDALALSESAVDHHYRHVRDRLQKELQRRVREQAIASCPEDAEAEFAQEWQRLKQYLRQQGDLEQVLEGAFAEMTPSEEAAQRRHGIGETVAKLTKVRRPPRRS